MLEGQKCQKMQYEIWGLYPPPIGGVSIHIKRLASQLNMYERVVLRDFKPKESYQYDYIEPVRNPFFVAIQLLFMSKRIIHVEQFSLLIFSAFILLGRRHHVGLTLHNQRSITIKNPVKKLICRFFFKQCDFIIMNDEQFSKRFVSYYKVNADKIHILPAFLPPDDSERKGLPVAVKKLRDKHDFVLSANAFRLRKDNGVDIYGLDMLVNLVARLRENNVDVGLLFLLPEQGDIQHYNIIKNRINDLNLTEHILIVEGLNDNGFEYWSISDLFVRPTVTDMEGVSVKEALSSGIHVLASDVCLRPKECMLFKSRDENDLYDKAYAFYQTKEFRNKIKYNSIVNVAKETLKIYKSLQ